MIAQLAAEKNPILGGHFTAERFARKPGLRNERNPGTGGKQKRSNLAMHLDEYV